MARGNSPRPSGPGALSPLTVSIRFAAWVLAVGRPGLSRIIRSAVAELAGTASLKKGIERHDLFPKSAISSIPSPRVNRPAAPSSSRSRRCCSAGVYPPRCAYRMLPSYASAHLRSRPELYELILVNTEEITNQVELVLGLLGDVTYAMTPEVK